MIIHGIQIMEGQGENDWTMSKIIALPVLKPFTNAKIKITGVGFVPNSDKTGRAEFPNIEIKYARKLIETGAFVANKDYQIVSGMDEETLEMVVTELIPVDEKLKQHFKQCLENSKG